MKINEFMLKGINQLELSVVEVVPTETPKGVVQIFHGMGEHKNRYIDFGSYLAKHGYVTVIHDHRKHGHSVRDPREVGIFTMKDQWEDVLTDCYIVSNHIQKTYPKLPITIMGHSMGSIIAREYIGRYNEVPSKVILMGTLPEMKQSNVAPLSFLASVIGLFSKLKPSPFLAKALNKPLLKTYKDPRTDFDWLSTDSAEVDKYVEDPLCGYPYSPLFYKEFAKAIVRVNTTDSIFEGRDIPMLIVSGREDPVGEFGTGVKQIRELYSGHGFLNITLKLFDNMRHEILNEKEKKLVYKYILSWLNE